MGAPPLLRNKFYRRRAVFTPENLLREARRQKRVAEVKVPMGKSEGDFEKGEAEGSMAVLALLGRIAEGWGRRRGKLTVTRSGKELPA